MGRQLTCRVDKFFDNCAFLTIFGEDGLGYSAILFEHPRKYGTDHPHAHKCRYQQHQQWQPNHCFFLIFFILIVVVIITYPQLP